MQTRYFVNGNHNQIICDLRPLSNICDRKKVGTEKVISKNLNFKFQIPFPLELHILRKALVILYTIKYDDMMILYMIKYDDMILRNDYMPHNSITDC